MIIHSLNRRTLPAKDKEAILATLTDSLVVRKSLLFQGSGQEEPLHCLPHLTLPSPLTKRGQTVKYMLAVVSIGKLITTKTYTYLKQSL